ncbi:glutathione S-transferase C-terminal domain-containing protein [Pokkaliibacter sp. CJK22405]|uniref:glutathione S-transferase C-terminal domain-containing protein n=1 Tax=Pokkaliibacter sp. CJK22405 TaxID=3384615 RepID=UPI00398469C2
MVVLHQFPAMLGLPNASPYCLKVEAFIRMAGIPFEIRHTASYRGPRGKLPFIEHDGTVVPESETILDTLTEMAAPDRLQVLTPEQQTTGHLLARMADYSLSWMLMYDRWLVPVTWPRSREAFFTSVPWMIRPVLAALYQFRVKRDCWAHGVGRLIMPERRSRLLQDLTCLSDVLGDKPYLFGDKPSRYDASCFGVIANMARDPLGIPSKQVLQGFPNLLAWSDRILREHFNYPN